MTKYQHATTRAHALRRSGAEEGNIMRLGAPDLVYPDTYRNDWNLIGVVMAGGEIGFYWQRIVLPNEECPAWDEIP